MEPVLTQFMSLATQLGQTQESGALKACQQLIENHGQVLADALACDPYLFRQVRMINAKMPIKNEAFLHLISRVAAMTHPPGPHDMSPRAQLFHELTRRVPDETKAVILAKLQALAGHEGEVQELLRAANEHNFDHPLFQNLDEMAYLALYGVEKGLMELGTFATLMNFRVAKLNYDNPRFIPLFVEGQPNPEAVSMINEMRLLNREGHFATVTPATEFMTEVEIGRLFEAMKSQPASEQGFMVGDDPDPFQGGKVVPDDISRTVIFATGINFLNRVISQKLRVIPSLGLMQASLNVRSGDNAVHINPVLDFSSLGDITNNALFGSRDMGIAFPGVNLPDVADRLKARGFDFPWHDYYHAILASGVPVKYQQSIAWMAQTISHIYFNSPVLEELATLLAEQLLDMEVTPFRREISSLTPMTEGARFWMGVAACVFQNTLLAAISNKHSNYSNLSHEIISDYLGLILEEFFKKFEKMLIYEKVLGAGFPAIQMMKDAEYEAVKPSIEDAIKFVLPLLPRGSSRDDFIRKMEEEFPNTLPGKKLYNIARKSWFRAL